MLTNKEARRQGRELGSECGLPIVRYFLVGEPFFGKKGVVSRCETHSLHMRGLAGGTVQEITYEEALCAEVQIE